MTVQAWLLFTPGDAAAAEALNDDNEMVIPRLVDNPLANNLGSGAIQTNGARVAPARILNNPDYARFVAVCGGLPIHVMDSDTLFLPDEQN